ncbi:WRKY Transcription Factor [Dionaea muscipula]
MDSSTWLSTSLDLNLNLNLKKHGAREEVHSNICGSPRQETGALVEELNRVKAENKRLTEMLTVVSEKYTALRRWVDLVSFIPPPATPSSNDHTNAKKRKPALGSNGNGNGGSSSNNNSESSSSEENFISSKKPKPMEDTNTMVKAKISRVYVRTEAASDSNLQMVKDGYQWRKYGQKVTRDNPSPRAYFKCSFAPSCPVKKKVQRSAEDQTVVVAIYEGEHNHQKPPCSSQQGGSGSTNNNNRPPPNMMTMRSIGSMPTPTANTITLDLTGPEPSDAAAATMPTPAAASTPGRKNNYTASDQFQKFVVEQMASSLTRDPNFTAALATAISGRFLNHN